MAARSLDFVIWGATGLTGKLITKYCAESAPKNLKWAIGGRTKSKLEVIKKELLSDHHFDVPIIIADSSDQTSINNLAQQCKVIIAAVGPFTKYGTPIVDACVSHGTHYCDITGEVFWVKEMIEKYHDKAVKNGVKIVPCCGFDSVPSDIGAYYCNLETQKAFGENCESIKAYYKLRGGRVSGGTLASVFNILESSPKQTPDIPKPKTFVSYEKDTKSWGYPFPMSMVNAWVARRSARNLGTDFSYDEMLHSSSMFKAFTGWFVLVLGIIMAYLPPTRWFLKKFVVPKPGAATEAAADSSFHIDFVGKTKSKKTVRAVMHGPEMYDITATFVSESAFTLIDEGSEGSGGVLMPSECFGNSLLEKLQNIDTLKFGFSKDGSAPKV